MLPLDHCYDKERDALSCDKNLPAVCHPPCRLWSRLSPLSIAPKSERDLALFAVDYVRKYGGVVEHPYDSKLWVAANCPSPGSLLVDKYGGFTLLLNQFDYGHLAHKLTGLYIVGVSRLDIPPLMPVRYENPIKTVETCSKKQREATPVLFASWLIQLAAKCTMPVD